MTLETKIDLPETVYAQEIDGEMVLLDMNSEHYFGLDGVGTAIWQAVEAKEGRLSQVLELLLMQYDVEETVLKNDLLAFVEKLRENGLIEVKEQ